MNKKIRGLVLLSSLLVLFYIFFVYNGPLANYLYGENVSYTLFSLFSTWICAAVLYFKPDLLNDRNLVFSVFTPIVLIASLISIFFTESHFLTITLFTIIGPSGFFILILLIEQIGIVSEKKNVIRNIGLVISFAYLGNHILHTFLKLKFNLVTTSITMLVMIVFLYLSSKYNISESSSIKLKDNKIVIYRHYLIFFLLNVRGGISEGMYEKTFSGISLSLILVLINLVLIYILILKYVKFGRTYYLIGIVLFSIGQSLFLYDSSFIGSFIMLSGAYAVFDIFNWGMMCYLSKLYESSNKIIIGGWLSGSMGMMLGIVISNYTTSSINAIICNSLIALTIIFVNFFFDELRKQEKLFDFYNKVNLDSKETLTPREREIVDLMITDMPLSEIASELFISSSTVKVHTRNIYRKMNVNNKKELINFYYTVIHGD